MENEQPFNGNGLGISVLPPSRYYFGLLVLARHKKGRAEKVSLIDWMFEHPYLTVICFLALCDAIAAIFSNR